MRTLRGFSLLELMLSLVLGGVVLTAGGRLLLALRQFLRAEREALSSRQTARAAATILAAELRGVSIGGADLLRMSDTAVTIRAMRGLHLACGPAPGGGTLIVRRDPLLSPRSIVPGSDSLLVMLPGGDAASDRWLHAAIAAVAGGSCADGTRGFTLRLVPVAADRAALDSVTDGAPVRVFETLTYRLYDDGTRTWWLGVRAWQGSSWAATSPLAGPLRPRDGLALQYFDASGAAVTADTAVRSIRVSVRATAGMAPAAGRRAGPHQDSLTLIVAPRNE